MDLRIDARQEAGVAVVSVAGDLDVLAVPTLASSLDAHLRAGQLHLVVDVSGVRFVDAAALGLLVGRMRGAQLAGGFVRLAGAPARLLRLLTITGLESTVPVFRSVHEATRRV